MMAPTLQVRPLRHWRLLLSAAACLGACADDARLESARSEAAPYGAPPCETPAGRVLSLRGIEPEAARAQQLVVQLARAPSGALRTRLAGAGFRELLYLPPNGLLIERGAGALSALSQLADVIGVTPYRARDRVSRELASETIAQRAEEEIPLLVHLLPGHADVDVRTLLETRAAQLLNSGSAGALGRVSALVAKADAAVLAEELSQLPGVFFVERVHHLGFFNDRSAGSVQSGMQGTSPQVTPIWARGLRGEGQVVGLIDSGLDVDSCFFADTLPGKLPKTNTWSRAGGYGKEVDMSHRKVIAYDFLYSCDQWNGAAGCEMPSNAMLWDNHGHGTHCAGSMAGDRPGARQNGMAPAAKIVVQDGGKTMNTCSEMPGLGCPVIDLYPIFEQAYAQGVRVHNNSYGDNEEAPAPNQSNYTARSQDVDRFMWDHKDMLIVFAAGNSGMGNRDFSVGSPSTNKNGLSVGSVRTSATSSSDQDLSSFSSRGWTADGRVKPDIVAPGCTVSAGNDNRIDSNNCGEDTGCGTSYAAPILVGAGALARQYFTEGFYPSGAKNGADARTPSAALLKAMLLNGAVPLTGRDNEGMTVSSMPSNEQGWGRLQLDRTLLFTGAARQLYVDDHKQGFPAGSVESVRYELKGVSADEPLKVTLVWTDFPGMPDSPTRAPNVNNVAALNAPRLVNDLDLSVQAGAMSYLGNVLMNGKSSAGGQADRRNNVEQVLINASGDVSIVIKAANVAQEAQDFALVVAGRWQEIGPASASASASASPSVDAGSASPRPTPDASIVSRGDGGAITQTVSDPVVAGAAPEAGAPPAMMGATGGQGVASSAEEDAAGCECSIGARSPEHELLPWLTLMFALRMRRRHSGRQSESA